MTGSHPACLRKQWVHASTVCNWSDLTASAARSLLAGKSGVGMIDRFDASEFPTKFAAQIRNFSADGCAK